MANKNKLLVIALSDYDPHKNDIPPHEEAIQTAPDASVQLSFKCGEKFEVAEGDLNWWLFVKSVKTEKQGYIPSTLVAPIKENLTEQEKFELDRGTELSAHQVNSNVDLKLFPRAPREKDVLNRKPCPEDSANIFSKLTFWWLNWLVWTGYKRPLKDEDLWALNKNNKASHMVPRIDKKYAEEQKKFKQKLLVERQTETSEDETAKLKEEEQVAEDDEKVAFEPKKLKRQKMPSLVKVVAKEFAGSLVVMVLTHLVYDILQFVQPQILKLLIEYTEDSSIVQWKGYVYAIAMTVAAITQSIFLHQYFHLALTIGMRLRTCILGLVYKKALVLSNASRKLSTAGEMVNLMSVDAQRLMDLMSYGNLVWATVFQTALALYFLFDTMGISVLAGFGVMVLLVPINFVVSKVQRKLQVKQMAEKDERIKMMNEILGGMKVLKLYAWEESFMKKVTDIRDKELRHLRNAAYLNAFFNFTFTCAPFLVSLATFAIYVYTGNELTAAKAFVALSLFNILRFPITMFPNVIVALVQAQVSIKRLTDFLNLEELDPSNVKTTMPEHISTQVVHVEDGTFSWDKADKPVLENINLNITKGSLVAVVGQVGCGKTTLLSALLGETETLEGQVYFKGSVAYVAQQAWIQNATLRDNILFGRMFMPKRYCKVVNACALRTDLDILAAGDQTEIGERGINLSGGQKQRVSLARAVYYDADVYLLDDPLSAVDSHVGKHIFDKVIGPRGVLRKKTRILVTHGISFLPQADQIVVLQDGRISEVGTYQELLDNRGAFAEFLKTFEFEKVEVPLIEVPELEIEQAGSTNSLDQLDETEVRDIEQLDIDQLDDDQMEEMDTPAPPKLERFVSTFTADTQSIDTQGIPRRGRANSVFTLDTLATTELCDCEFMDDKEVQKVIEEERSQTGRVKMSVFLTYAKSIGILFAISIVFFLIIAEVSMIGSRLWLAEWSAANVTSSAERDMFLGVYGGLGLSQSMFVLLSSLSMAFATMKASRNIHKDMLVNVMHSPMSFFETTPLGRIVNRFSKDINVVDNTIPRSVLMFLRTFLNVVGTICAITYATPIFLVVIVFLGVLYVIIQRVYVAVSRQLKRIESVSRSPIYNFFFETISGASTIRAFWLQDHFIRENYYKIDENQVAYYPSIASNRWLAMRLEFLGNLIIFFAALFAVISRGNIAGGLVGLSITYAMQITQTLNMMVRQTSEVEANIVSVERAKEYAEVSTEAAWILPDSRPPDDWPREGKIQIDAYNLRYREELPLVLKNIDCVFYPGEKIGIVGRTGAGKSSLTLALFRLLESAGGTIIIDGVDISKIGLQDLRSRLTIIPQDPVLFSGTLRLNLDPFDRYSDEELWKVLEVSHLKTFVTSLEKGLQHPVAEGGDNLSVGQRQLVCLARALLRKSKILVLDEATAAVDLETDEFIQETIRKEFAERTVLTIAHRLNTIMDYSRILVLDKGFIAEFDTPINLLAQQGIFYSMAHDAGLA